MKLAVIIFIMLINMPCFGLPTIERNTLHDPYTYDISKIVEYRIWRGANSESKKQVEIIEIKNGIFFIKESGGTRVCYNIYHNNRQSISEIRLLEIIHLGIYEINHFENKMEILGIIGQRSRGERGYEDWERIRVQIIFEFDDDKKIKNYKIINQDDNILKEEYLFQYDDEGRLESISSVHSWGNVLRKVIYYDGKLRILERPFFNDLMRSNIDEVIILENNILKYHSKRFFWISTFMHRPRLSEDFLTNDEYHYSYLVEFDERGALIVDQFLYHFTNKHYQIEYTQFDERGNWINMKSGVYEYIREIEYKE